MRLFGELTKIEDQPDGTLKVYGVASTGARDDAGEIVLPQAMKAALPDYARYPALREMHQPTAAGRTLEATVDDDGVTRIVAHVVDPVAIAKVKSRTYSGFSIGGKVLSRDKADATVITKIRLSEISLVDRPANPEAVIDLWKADAAPVGNESVKGRAAVMAKAAGRPGSWKDYVAKARAALMAEQPAPDDDDEDPSGLTDDTQTAANDNWPEADDAGDAPDDASVDDPAGSDDPGDIAARLAALAQSDPDALQSLHDALAALGARCDPDNCPDAAKASLADDLAKALPRVEALERRLAAQDARIERLAATPLPPRTAASPHARAVGKADDADPGGESHDLSAAEAQKAFAALTSDERAFLLMKASLRQPIPLG
ncbi:MAG TPA: HK97 family phage prohead protease [Caulobacteraceae bacterium]|jgi:HK97 family phage prohead protease|nr:HK97 family phage prohead protease [Caulobacteraceae bacterium]